MTYAIIHGNPISGLRLVGPFPNWDACQEHLSNPDLDLGGDAWIAELVAPGPDLSRYEKQWVDTWTGNRRILTFDEVEALGLDGTGRTT